MYNQQRLKKVALMLMMSMLCLISFAQERQVQGIVKDKSGEPMIGVNVLVKGTTNGTITGVDGDFTLSGVKMHPLALTGGEGRGRAVKCQITQT